MMGSLVGQLLTQMIERELEVDISFLTKTNLRSIERIELEILCVLFRELTTQLPPKTVLFCVLDELSMYETSSLGRETDAIVRRLTRLVVKSEEVILKVLITCRGRSLDFHKYFDNQDILDLQEDIEDDDIAMWRIKNFAAD